MRASKVHELIDYILTLVHFIGVSEYLGQFDSGRLIPLKVVGAELLVHLDEALPCLRVVGLYAGGGVIRLLGTRVVTLLVRGKGKEDMAGERSAVAYYV